MRLRDKTEAQVKKLYINPKEPGAFRGAAAFIRNQGLERNSEKVKKTLLELKPFALHVQSKDKFPRRRVQVNFGDFQHVTDLLDYTNYSKSNKGYKWILLVQDSFTKKLFLEPLKSKRPRDVIAGFKEIYKRTKVPVLLNSDAGKEYVSRESEAYFKSIGVTRFNSFSAIKVAQAESTIKVLRSIYARYFTAHNTHNWINVLKDVESSYNNTWHSSIQMAPAQYKPYMEGDVWNRLYSKSLMKPYTKKPKYSVNQRVRISKYKFLFKKASAEQSFSQEVFIIHTVKVRRLTFEYSIT